MIKIAICDDDEKSKSSLINALNSISENREETFEIHQCCKLDELLEKSIGYTFDIIFLEVDLPRGKEVMISRRLQEKTESLIIYVSQSDDILRDLFDINTIGFLDKPYEMSKLERLMSKACQIIETKKSIYFEYHKSGRMQLVHLDKITYLEVINKQIKLHTLDETITYRGTLKLAWERLSKNKNFVMPHQSYILNLAYSEYTNNDILLKQNGKKIVIGRKFKPETYQRYLSYIK